MCKPHDQLHYQPVMREVASILAGEGNSVTRDLLLRSATVVGLEAATRELARFVPPADLVRVKSRLEAETAAVRLAAQERVALHAANYLESLSDEPPF